MINNHTGFVPASEAAELRRELAEANNIINAIRCGEVDALLVSREADDEIYILQGADHIYRTLVEEMQEGCITAASDGSILFCNKNMARMLNTPLDTMIGSSLYSISYLQDQKALTDLLTGRTQSFKAESRLKNSNGWWVPVFISASNITIDNTKFTCLVITDLTEQVRSKQFALMIFNAAKEPIIACDTQGRIIQVNPAACAMFGGRLVGSAFDDVISLSLAHKDAKFRLNQADNFCTSSNGIEVKYKREDGKSLYLLMNVGCFHANKGEIATGYVITLIDITDKWLLANEMARFDRLNLIGEIAAGIGHEVRNPLTTVRGYLQMFQRRPENNNDYEQFALMIDELDRANSIITDFLSLAKASDTNMQPGRLTESISTLFPLLQADAFRLGHSIKTELSSIPVFVYDAKEIRQLILNMVRNGLEAMISPGVVTIQTYTENNGVVLAISDTGTGIPETVLHKLGTPFMTTKENGTGLGLPVCYRIAAHHGAEINVKTSPTGTTFLIKFKPPTGI